MDTVSIVGDVSRCRWLTRSTGPRPRAARTTFPALRRILSVGVTWSADVKRRLLAHGDFVCRDLIAASEGGPFARQRDQARRERGHGAVLPVPGARVVDDEGRDVVPGSGQVGMLAAPADDQIRYLGDQKKTQETFRIFGGERWVVTGDLASLETDGSVTFHGRGSRVINTGARRCSPGSGAGPHRAPGSA